MLYKKLEELKNKYEEKKDKLPFDKRIKIENTIKKGEQALEEIKPMAQEGIHEIIEALDEA